MCEDAEMRRNVSKVLNSVLGHDGAKSNPCEVKTSIGSANDALAFMTPMVTEYLERDAGGIDGWLSLTAAWMLGCLIQRQRECDISGDAVEIGCWEGRTLFLLQRFLSREEGVHGFDIELRPQLKANIERFSHVDGATIDLHEIDSRKLSSSAVRETSPRGVRIFHVDGYHSLENARHDLSVAFASTASEGIIVLDDFFAVTLPGVTEAFFELIHHGSTNEFFPFALGGGKLFLATGEFLDHYRDALFDLMPISSMNGEGVDHLCGHRVAIYGNN